MRAADLPPADPSCRSRKISPRARLMRGGGAKFSTLARIGTFV